MQVIILKNHQIKNVADGYAMNYLLPQKLAVIVTEEKIKNLKTQEKKKEKLIKEETKEFDFLVNKLKNKKIILSKPASEKGKLFAAVSKNEILSALGLEKYKVEINQHIKEIGEHKIEIQISKLRLPIIVEVKKK